MNKNYAILNLRIPLEIFETGKYKLYKDRMDIGIERCIELPCQKNNSDYRDVLEVIREMLEPREKIKWQGTDDEDSEEDSEDEDSEDEDSDEDEETEYSKTEGSEGTNEDYDLESKISYGNDSDIEEEDTEDTENKDEPEKKSTEGKSTEGKSTEGTEPELRVYPHEIKLRKKHGSLMTFKNRIKPKNTFTRKLLNLYNSDV